MRLEQLSMLIWLQGLIFARNVCRSNGIPRDHTIPCPRSIMNLSYNFLLINNKRPLRQTNSVISIVERFPRFREFFITHFRSFLVENEEIFVRVEKFIFFKASVTFRRSSMIASNYLSVVKSSSSISSNFD